ncbi:MAG TPA: hypothetical protein VG895_05760 [Patescibacteria group bacterium]|nr:hypothetical protein [Patescibacteria group bacterium]
MNYTEKSHKALNNIKKYLTQNSDIIPINYKFYLTKGYPGNAKGYLYRDKRLEKSVKNIIESNLGYHVIIKRYQAYDNSLGLFDWPEHYAIKLLNVDGVLSTGNNIFMFFPEVLGINTENIADYFGFEFVDAWVSVFDKVVFPCIKQTFCLDSQYQFYQHLNSELEHTIYLASIFHEIGHRVSCWKVSPAKHPQVSLSKFHTDIMGELSTDTLLVNLLPEFPELGYFVLAQRLFWFGRKGFSSNHLSGAINQDNDAWIGSYLWNKSCKIGCIEFIPESKKLILNAAKIIPLFSLILEDLNQLGLEVINASPGNQDMIVHQWLCKNLEFVDNQFILPTQFRNVLAACINICETPAYDPKIIFESSNSVVA